MTDDVAPDTAPDRSDGLASRRAALDLVSAALDHRGGLDEAMTRAPFADLELRDRALARMLAMTLLRRLGGIDRLLQPRLRTPPPAPVLMLLRLGMAQALYMDTPAFAAVDTVVRLAQAEETTRPFKGLINAVLRGVLRDPPPAEDAEALAPGWIYARWRAAYGAEAALALAPAIALEPATDVTPRDPADAAALAPELEAEALPGGSLRVRRKGDVADWPGFFEGRWWVQDAAAAIPARLLGAGPGLTALDMCAAPGGKALQLAATGAAVTALDRSPARLRLLTQTLERTGLAAEIVASQAERWSDRRTFDRVLLDAPCSATGTFRRHPDVLWGTKPGDIAKLAGVQARLLDVAAERVSPGGRLVYCVCSLEPEEGEAQADGFALRHPDFRLEPIGAGEGGAPAASIDAAGRLRVLPHHLDGGLDGFFAARWVRAG
jgi:16S rRNA (cytosine967-C5)-methyltransferase